MLLLGSKTMTIDGITVFFDHADPSQFWYLPGPIRLARRQEDQRAAFSFIKYKPAAVAGGAKGGGFVTFETNLKLDPEQERRILSKLSSVSRARPKLAVVPFDEGTVQCIALNIQGAGGTAATTAAAGTFNAVEKILGASVPSLDGLNTAAFSLTLSQEGATLLEEAFEKGTSPIGVIYDLKYTGMRPALEVKITADFKRVYDQFSVGLDAQVYFVEAGIEAGFEKLVQDGVIKIEVTNYTGDADLKDKEKWALDFFKDNLLKEWFQPTLSPGQLAGGGAKTTPLEQVMKLGSELRPPTPPAPPPKGTDVPPPTKLGPSPTAGLGPKDEHADPFKQPAGTPAAAGTATGTTTGATTAADAQQSPTAGLSVPAQVPPPNTAKGTPAGASSSGANAMSSSSGMNMAVVSFKLKYVKQEELKTLTLQYNVQEATQRTYAPQGFFGLLLADLSKSNHFVEVDLDDPFFRVFTVSAEAPIDFSRIGLQSLQVSLDYGDLNDATDHKHADFVFDNGHKDAQKFEVFMNKWRDTTYRYKVQYHFDPLSDWEGKQSSYEMPEVRTEDRTLLLNPFNDIGFLEIKVKPHRMDTGILESTEVFLQFIDADQALKEKTILVMPDSAEQAWKLRINKNADRTFSYRMVHHLKDGTTREIPATRTKATTIFVDDPFQDALELQIIPSFDPGTVKQAFVDLEYNDLDNTYSRSERISMKGSATDIVPFRISIIDNKKRTFRYRITVVGSDGKLHQNPFVETDDEFISVA